MRHHAATPRRCGLDRWPLTRQETAREALPRRTTRSGSDARPRWQEPRAVRRPVRGRPPRARTSSVGSFWLGGDSPKRRDGRRIGAHPGDTQLRAMAAAPCSGTGAGTTRQRGAPPRRVLRLYGCVNCAGASDACGADCCRRLRRNCRPLGHLERALVVARQERLERHRRCDVPGVTRQHIVERELRFERRFEGASRVELQGSRQPSPERIGDGLAAAHDGVLGRRCQKRRQVSQVVVAERPPEDEGERDHANLHDVGAMVQARGTRARRQGDAQVLPKPLTAVGE